MGQVQGRTVAVAATIGGVLLAATLLVGVLPVWRAISSSAAPLRVDVVGDSLIRQAEVNLQDRLADAGFDYSLDSEPAKDLGSDFVQSRLEALSPDDGDVLVLATATNDAVREYERAALAAAGDAQAEAEARASAEQSYRDLLDRVLARFPQRCIVVVNAREDISPLYHPEHAHLVNADLRLEQRDRRNLVVVDWASTSKALPTTWFASDQLHFGPDPSAPVASSGSAREYANAIVGGIRQCAARKGLPS